MRPQGEVWMAILSTLREQGPMPMRELAERSQVGYDATRRTVDNAVRAKALEIVGHEKVEHCKKWVAIYDVVEERESTGSSDGGLILLDGVMRGWR